MDHKLLADRLFPHINTTPEDIEARYPKRDLPEGAKVTRMGPSPTGFMHIGGQWADHIAFFIDTESLPEGGLVRRRWGSSAID